MIKALDEKEINIYVALDVSFLYGLHTSVSGLCFLNSYVIQLLFKTPVILICASKLHRFFYNNSEILTLTENIEMGLKSENKYKLNDLSKTDCSLQS